ncbi:hypothetical protein BWQ96_04991 [Gracilariopsis chorda]|uniref:Uncharacterized protein n=1 Tax=Gracilariopsis chorda TaxID=448386 RepID=A0A2V3ISX1_9FLOR|nr:hypothetical protein BWQ96_04991 [Gracilariopsis chorda]|eukprot:PXF45225.1 hypothetical protein BWQ96_04991 [Gracilariopsis chorda]
MATGSQNSDSSLESDEHLLYLGTLEEFRIKRKHVRATRAKQPGGGVEQVKIRRMSDIDVSSEENWLRSSNLQRFRMRKTAKDWTAFFMSQDILLQGPYECANLLRNSSSSNPLLFEADRYFPYCSTSERVVHGHVVAEVPMINLTKVHLSSRRSHRITLKAQCVYLIGKVEEEAQSKPCYLCWTKHDLNDSPCPSISIFVPLPSHAHLKTRIYDRVRCGARVLTKIAGQNSTLACSSGREDLCTSCLARAVRSGCTWFKMDGTCNDWYCPNDERCDCVEESDSCSHYIYIPDAKRNNIVDDDLAVAVAEGKVRVLTGALESEWRRKMSYTVRKLAMKALKSGAEISVDSLVRTFSAIDSKLSKCEVMAMAMYDTRLADLIDGHKSFTLNDVNGFVRNAEATEVGPWLAGRLVRDAEGIWWQTARSEPLLVSTRDAISTVSKASVSSLQTSDELGRLIG